MAFIKGVVILFGGLLILGFLVGDFMPSHSADHGSPQSATALASAAGTAPATTARLGDESDGEKRAELLRAVKLKYTWSKTGFGSVMEADFSVQNPLPFAFKDFTVHCTHYANSGTAIDSNTRTIYDVVPPKSTKRIQGFSMGFISSQVRRSGCEIVDLVVASDYVPPKPTRAKKTKPCVMLVGLGACVPEDQLTQ